MDFQLGRCEKETKASMTGIEKSSGETSRRRREKEAKFVFSFDGVDVGVGVVVDG